MQRTCDTVLRISPSKAEIVVEQEKKGVISRKLITPETLAKCFLSSRYDTETHATGLLPEGCISVVITPKHTAYYIRCPELYADICYYGTVYSNFPLPRLVFELRYMPAEGKIAKCRLCVVKDERLTMDTPTYRYPFSNVGFDGSICVGNNALPRYKDPARLGTLPGHILRMPNNNDHFSKDNNALKLEYRDLLEQMKGKEPSHYYTDLLIPDGKTLGSFIKGGTA
ncbi:MAG: hypothetical protein RR949_01880 [Oscillospiraceae bacterium]